MIHWSPVRLPSVSESHTDLVVDIISQLTSVSRFLKINQCIFSQINKTKDIFLCISLLAAVAIREKGKTQK